MIISFHLTKSLFTTCFTLKVACGMILNNTDAVKGLYQTSGKMLFCIMIFLHLRSIFLFCFFRKLIVIHSSIETDRAEIIQYVVLTSLSIDQNLKKLKKKSQTARNNYNDVRWHLPVLQVLIRHAFVLYCLFYIHCLRHCC